MGNYISSKYNHYFDNNNNSNKYKKQFINEELLHSPISNQSFDLDCPSIFENNMVILPNNQNIITNPFNETPSSNLEYLKKRYNDLLIYNSYLKLEYNNYIRDNNNLLEKIEKLERENTYFKHKIYKINIEESPFKNRRKTV